MSESDLMYKAASLYFEENLTQQQIAHKLGVSRIKVSRILQQARVEGIVEITLNKPQRNFSEEENIIARKWDLMETVLSPTSSGGKDDLLRQLGQTASEYAQRILLGVQTVSLAWGSSLSAFVQNLPKMDHHGIRIIQMLGGLGSPEKTVHSSDLVRKFSDKTGGMARILSAPGIVSSAEVKAGLMEDAYINETLSMAAATEVAFVGIGTAAPDSILMRQGEILPSDVLEEIKAVGAVGDIALRFFNSAGEIIGHPINERIVGISAAEIRAIPRVVAIAGGKEKREAVKGALRSGLIDVLITDYETGINLLMEK